MSYKEKQKLLVVGNGMAAMRTIEHILSYQEAASTNFDITVVGAEPHGNYNRIMLSPVLAGEKHFSDIMLHTHEWYQNNNITLLAGKRVEQLDRAEKIATLDDGLVLHYDKLLLATGSDPFIIPVTGKELPGVLSYRTIEDVEEMQSIAKQHKHAVVIGAGVLGLEAAFGLQQQGMQVSVVHNAATIMNRQLDEKAACMLQQHLEGLGITFHLEKNSAACEGVERVEKLVFSDGEAIAADLVVMAVGVRANTLLAEKSGLACERGIVVDDYLCTDDDNVYAVGECVQHRGATYGLVAPLFEQAVVCAKNILGLSTEPYLGSQLYTSLKVTGVNLYSAGDFNGDESSESIIYDDPANQVYKKIVINNNRIIGLNLYGDISDAVWYQDLYQQKKDISGMREDMIFGKAFIADEAA